MKKSCIGRIIFLAILLVCNGVSANSKNIILKGDSAYQWVSEHLDSLADSYIEKNGNILDPDIVRDELTTIGYNRLNVTDYIMASRQIDSLVLIKLIDRAEVAGNKTIFFMMGSTAAGKSTALRNNPDLNELVNRAGLVYDGAFISIPSFETRLRMVKERGFKASVVFVHNDPETGFSNMINRMIRTIIYKPSTIYQFFELRIVSQCCRFTGRCRAHHKKDCFVACNFGTVNQLNQHQTVDLPACHNIVGNIQAVITNGC